MPVTKNRQPSDILIAMARKAFPEKTVADVRELTAGYFNAAYMFTFADGSRSVVKIAANNSDGLMSNEVNMMTAEIRAMDIARANGIPHVAQVQYHDATRTLCSGEYFFMEALPGDSYDQLRKELSDGQRAAIDYEIGAYEKALTPILGTHFGMVGDDQRKFSCLYDFVRYLLSNAIADGERRNVALPLTGEQILSALEKDRAVFDEVTQPTLVHWDMWPGNIFIQDGHISGVIDWERAMWADPLIDDRFRRHSRCPAFLEGFGLTQLSDSQYRRILWYDVFLYLTMMVECFYRLYETLDQYHHAQPRLMASWEELERCRMG